MLHPDAPETQRRTRLSLIDADPDLGALLDGETLQRARTELHVGSATVETGPWDLGRLHDVSCANAGLLILDGVIAREVVLGAEVSSELLGAGDLIRPWSLDAVDPLLALEVRWNVLGRGRIAILDAAFHARAAAFPGVGAMLLERVEARARRLATLKAISQLTRVDRRLMAVARHFCERWGRVTRDGVVLPLCLSHRMLGELIGARRPSVSTAAAALERSGELVRRPDGTWLVRGDGAMAVPERAPKSVPQRRRLVPVPDAPSPFSAVLGAPVADAVQDVTLAAAQCGPDRSLRAMSVRRELRSAG